MQDNTRLLAPGVPIALTNQDSGATKEVTLKFTARAVYLLEEEFGSLDRAIDTLKALSLGTKEPDLEGLWEAVHTCETPEDWTSRFESSETGVSVLIGLLTDTRSVKRVRETARFLAAGLYKYNQLLEPRGYLTDGVTLNGRSITSDELIDWLTFNDLTGYIHEVTKAFVQALPESTDDEGKPSGNESAPASTGETSTTTAPSDTADVTPISGK